MSRQPAPRALSLTEELEKLEQSITLTLQEIDSNFSKAHRIVTSSILPLVEDYAKHSNDVWEGSKFWKQFFEASANVSLSGYEEAPLEDTHTDMGDTEVDDPDENNANATDGPAKEIGDDDISFTIDSPTQVTGEQTTPRLAPSTAKKINGKASLTKSTLSASSPSPRKYTGKNAAARTQAGAPATPRGGRTNSALARSSPFEPDSAYQPQSTRTQQTRSNNDPLMHRSVLDKNYRIQATPHTQRKQKEGASGAAESTKRNNHTFQSRAPWDDSPQSSPMAAPQLRSDLFSPQKGGAAIRTPGVSVLSPAIRRTAAITTSTGRRLFSPQDTTFASARKDGSARGRGSNAYFDEKKQHSRGASYDEEDDSDLFDVSPPKTLQFHVPASRLLQTPAREASKKIVEDLLLTAGADATDDIEGLDEFDDTGRYFADQDGGGVFEDDDGYDEAASPSVVRASRDNDTF